MEYNEREQGILEMEHMIDVLRKLKDKYGSFENAINDLKVRRFQLKNHTHKKPEG